jgi:hypothetical protein
LILFGVADFSTWHVFAGIGGIFLIAGLWTPATGILIAIVESWIAWSLYRSRLPAAEMHAFLAGLSVSVAMLGPGAWSVDARLFGRKRFDVDGRRAGKHTSKGVGIVPCIKGHDRDRSGDDSIAEKPDNPN